MLENSLESPLDCKEIQSVHPKGDQSLVFIGQTDVEAETPIVWPPDAKSWLIWKDPDSGEDWRQEKGMTEDEMVEWHHWLNGHGFGWTLGVGDVQGGLAMLWFMGSQRVRHEWVTELNWTVTVPFQLISPFFHTKHSSLSLFFSLSIFLSFFFYISLPVFLYFPSIVIYTVYFPWVLHIHGFHMGRWPVLHYIQIRNTVNSVGFLPNLSTRDDWIPILE